LKRAAFLDVETTGLAGGAGTYAFLVGLGWFEGGDFRLRQLFMRDYSEERALISLLEDTLASLSGIVSFNGKAFDVPLLESRFILSRRRFPLSSAPHLDLLHTARRLWRLRLESCRLSHLETEILGLQREGDVPSYLVPQLYFDYLRYGRAEPLKGVFYHNAQDILSLAALTSLSCASFEEPLGFPANRGEDLYSLSRLYTDLRLGEQAETTLRAALDTPLPEDLRRQAVYHLSFLLKRQERWKEAEELWQLAMAEDHGLLYPFEELAKYYEHRQRDFARAEEVVQRAIDLVQTSNAHRGGWWAQQRLAELEHRLKRVQLKMARQRNSTGQSPSAQNEVNRMSEETLALSFAEITEVDLPELTEVMTRAFDDDAQKHRGLEKGGPEGYDNGDFFRTWLLPYEESVGYKMLLEDQTVGGIIVWVLPDGHNILGTIFVDPAYQDRGVGTQTWEFIEATYPETKSWRLATPDWATKNHHFYAVKCGFSKVDSDPIIGLPPEETSIYSKEMGDKP
ncbi:MAG: GNAT family N-acetyltransferase, partial [Anaerolineae bacterium]|nr:GNAT family N-acetyltransferase [Anaerolineae bacterium]